MSRTQIYLAVDPPRTSIPEDAFSYDRSARQLSIIACIPDAFCNFDQNGDKRGRTRSREEQSLHLCHKVLRVTVDVAKYLRGPSPLGQPAIPNFEVDIIDRPKIEFDYNASKSLELFGVSPEELNLLLGNIFNRIPGYIDTCKFEEKGRDQVVDSIVSKTVYLYNMCLRIFASRNSIKHNHPDEKIQLPRSVHRGKRYVKLAPFNKPLRSDIAHSNMMGVVEHITNRCADP